MQRIRLAPGAVQREHELAAEAFPKRVVGDEALELAEKLGVPTQLELRVDPFLDDAEAELLELGDGRLRKAA